MVLITTGSQGEAMAALSRIAASIHRKITIKPGDVVIFSSRPIPGNEKSVSKVINELSQKGAKVIIQDTHVSGHACEEEVKLIYSLVKPKYAIPVHGEYRHLIGQGKVAEQMGVPKENVQILQSGDILELKEDSMKIVGKAQAQGIMVDGLGVGDVGNIVLRDRRLLSQDGIIVVCIPIDMENDDLAARPEVVSRGFVYVKESEELLESLRRVATETVDGMSARKRRDEGDVCRAVRSAVSSYLYKHTKRSPMIIPMVTKL